MSADDKVLGLFIGHTESRNRYNIVHPDPRNIGIVGATPSQWGRFLKIRKIPINSLRAGVVIFNYYLKEEKSWKNCLFRIQRLVDLLLLK